MKTRAYVEAMEDFTSPDMELAEIEQVLKEMKTLKLELEECIRVQNHNRYKAYEIEFKMNEVNIKCFKFRLKRFTEMFWAEKLIPYWDDEEECFHAIKWEQDELSWEKIS